jgi:hypothetical protein
VGYSRILENTMAAKDLPKLVLNRTYVLSTLKGHSVGFIKGVPTHVPPSVFAEAIAIGATPVDGSDPNILEDEAKDHAPADPADRNPLILAAIEKLVDRNERDDFTAAGSPTVSAVSAAVGFKVQAREIANVWQMYHDKLAAQ